jgi:hypothetical protein
MMSERLKALLAALLAWPRALADALGRRAQAFSSLIKTQSQQLRADAAAQSGTVTTVVTVGATLLIGIIVMSQIVESIPTTNNTFSGAITQVTSILNSSFLLAAILPLVIVAGAVLFFVGNFGNNGR